MVLDIDLHFSLSRGARCAVVVAVLTIVLPLLFLVVELVFNGDVRIRLLAIDVFLFAPPVLFLTCLTFDVVRDASDRKELVQELAMKSQL